MRRLRPGGRLVCFVRRRLAHPAAPISCLRDCRLPARHHQFAARPVIGTPPVRRLDRDSVITNVDIVVNRDGARWRTSRRDFQLDVGRPLGPGLWIGKGLVSHPLQLNYQIATRHDDPFPGP